MRYAFDTELEMGYLERDYPQLIFMDIFPTKIEMTFKGEYLLAIL